MFSKLEFRDLINYLVPSSLLFSIGSFLFWNFNFSNSHAIVNSEIINGIILVSVLYVVGHFLRLNFDSLLKYKLGTLDNRLLKLIYRILVGKPNKKDLRKIVFDNETNPNKNAKYFKKSPIKEYLAPLDSKKERFNIVVKYVAEKAQPTNLYTIERFFVSFSLSHRLVVVFMLAQLAFFAVVVLNFCNVGKSEYTTLLFLLSSSAIGARISYKQFEKFYDMWCRSNIRTFYCLIFI
jgi:hypothetical protein